MQAYESERGVPWRARKERIFVFAQDHPFAFEFCPAVNNCAALNKLKTKFNILIKY